MRANYNGGELDGETLVLDGITKALRESANGSAVTSLRIVDMYEAHDNDGRLIPMTVDEKCRSIAEAIGADWRVLDDHVSFIIRKPR